MNEEGGIYRKSFHLTWAKNMGFHGQKKSRKITFFASNGAPGTCACHFEALSAPDMRQEL